jgi:hypothetical protein
MDAIVNAARAWCWEQADMQRRGRTLCADGPRVSPWSGPIRRKTASFLQAMRALDSPTNVPATTHHLRFDYCGVLLKVHVPTLPDGVAATVTFRQREAVCSSHATTADHWLYFDITRGGIQDPFASQSLGYVGRLWPDVTAVSGWDLDEATLAADDGREFPVAECVAIVLNSFVAFDAFGVNDEPSISEVRQKGVFFGWERLMIF